jgi:hypothetical protein
MAALVAASTPRIERLLTPLRESIVDKLPCISGTLQLPDSYFSLFYKVAKGGYAARLRPLTSRRPEPLLTFLSCYRHINFANATPTRWNNSLWRVRQPTTASNLLLNCNVA